MNMVKKAYKFRLYPNTEQVECFQWTLERCRELYNAAIEERRYAYQRVKRDAGYYDRETRQALTGEYAATFTKQSEQLPPNQRGKARIPGNLFSNPAGCAAPRGCGI